MLFEKPIIVAKQKINAFMLFSISNYAMGLSTIINREFVEINILPISNAINEYQPIWIIAIMGIGYSLFKSYRLSKSTGLKALIRTFGRSGIELQIMLWGTLASIFFFAAWAFSNSTEIKIGITIFSIIMIITNVKRDKIIDWLMKKWLKL